MRTLQLKGHALLNGNLSSGRGGQGVPAHARCKCGAESRDVLRSNEARVRWQRTHRDNELRRMARL